MFIVLCNREEGGEKVLSRENIAATFRWLLMAFAIIARDFQIGRLNIQVLLETYGGSVSKVGFSRKMQRFSLTSPLSQNFNRFSVIISSLVVFSGEEVKIFLHQIKITFKMSLCYFCRRFSTWYFLRHIN